MEKFYFLGHLCYKDGRQWIARHGTKKLCAPTRSGLINLITTFYPQFDALDLCEFLAAQIVENLKLQFDGEPKTENEHLTIIAAKKLHAQIVALMCEKQWKR